MSLYLDTSAAAKLIVDEDESEALAAYIDSSMNEQELVSSAFLETELRRLAIRLEFDQSVVTDLLARVDLVDPPRSLFHEAGLLPGAHLRSLDALHLATALRVDCEFFLAYDKRLVDAARAVGLSVRSPS
jgi:predicted nucleic acid-binding protein